MIDGRPIIGKHDQFWVSEWKCPHGMLRDYKNKPNFGPEKYHGNVYCATVPNGTLIVRRNGRPLIAGNCLRYLLGHNLDYVKPEPPLKEKNWALAYLEWKQKKHEADQPHGIILGPASCG